MADKPPVIAELLWSQALQFGATSGTNAIVVDGDNAAGPSPVQLLAMSLAGCMSIDIVDILRKGRHPLQGFRSKLTGQRAEHPPRRLIAVQLEFTIRGAVPESAVERAIALSRDRYCSVWHSLREDIQLTSSYVIHAE
jgi:putative redox protein